MPLYKLIISRTTFLTLFLFAAFTGCYRSSSYYMRKLVSHLPRADGSVLSVRCVSHVKHTVSSILPQRQPTPRVVVILDDQTFTIYADRVMLNDELYADLASDVKEIYIEFTEEGFEVEADGEPITNRQFGDHRS